MAQNLLANLGRENETLICGLALVSKIAS